MAEEFLEHYGTPRHSGRYPWGSGKDPYQRSVALKKYVNELKAQGISETDMAKALGFRSTKQMRAFISISNSEIKKQQYLTAQKLKEKGYSNAAIGEALKPPMGESSVRNLLDPSKQARQQVTENIAKVLTDGLEKGKLIDLGEGTELYVGTNATKLNTAVEYLRQQGYEVHEMQLMQQATGKYTNMKILCPKGMSWKEAYANRDKIGLPDDWISDDGFEIHKLKEPVLVDRDRILVRYAEEGGADRDGTVELRPGVEDLSLGDASYAQVRIGVEGKRYMKGMAFYNDDIPEGYDIVYNTNKAKGASDDKVFKKMDDDPDNPFGASIKQHDYTDAKGESHLSAINKVGSGELANEEGKWGEWSRKLPSQFLSKQPIPFAKKQLKLLADSKQEELDEIMQLTNPVVKRQLLMDFADSCDSSSVSLEAAALPRQSTKVLLPDSAGLLKFNEIFAPAYNDGEEVALVRFPHGGTFEIPVLTVNNSKALVEAYTKYSKTGGIDKVHVTSDVAARLSGADFDGDTVLVLPTKDQKIKSTDPLPGLVGYDPKDVYKLPEGVKNKMQNEKTGERLKQTEMGKVSNLITDMTIRGAPTEDIAKAVRHSMTIIDAKKHNLDYEQSAIDNDIARLKREWQIKPDGKTGGSSTLLSSPKATIDTFTDSKIDPKTGKKIRETKVDDTYVDKDGKIVHRQTQVKKLSIVDDAFELSSGTKIEAVYAEHSNRLKEMANAARKEALATENIPYSPSAKKTYSEEVASLNSKLNEVLKNKPKERAAQAIAGKVVADKIKADPSLKENKDKLKKIRNQQQAIARARTGAKRAEIWITDKEWNAIQAGAISSTTLAKILTRADKNRVRQLATPRDAKVLGDSTVARAKAMIDRGMTLAETASALGISVSSVNRALEM